jgi:hypothetical protein
MLTFFVGFGGAGEAGLEVYPKAGPSDTPPPWVLTRPARLSLAPDPGTPAVLTVELVPATLTLAAAALDPDTLHYFRLADGSVKPLPPAPLPITCQAGDAYIAITPATARLAAAELGGPGPAVARFLHLRDDFNAERLAQALLDHLRDLAPGAAAQALGGVAVMVIEAR